MGKGESWRLLSSVVLLCAKTSALKAWGKVAGGCFLASGPSGFVFVIWASSPWSHLSPGVQVLGPQRPAAALMFLGTRPPLVHSAGLNFWPTLPAHEWPFRKSHNGFSLAATAAVDPMCLVELSEGARGSLNAKCRFLGDDMIQAV